MMKKMKKIKKGYSNPKAIAYYYDELRGGYIIGVYADYKGFLPSIKQVVKSALGDGYVKEIEDDTTFKAYKNTTTITYRKLTRKEQEIIKKHKINTKIDFCTGKIGLK